MKTSTEEKLIARLNLLAEEQRDLDARRAEVFRDWVAARADLIRAGNEPGDFPVLKDGEHGWLARKEQLLRDRLADEPAHQQALRQINDLAAAERQRLSAA
jgi:phage terminase Nu1 subunit (DNA packaging protein)